MQLLNNTGLILNHALICVLGSARLGVILNLGEVLYDWIFASKTKYMMNQAGVNTN